MGQTLYISLDRAVGGIEPNNDRVFLAKLVGQHDSLTALAGELGTASLSEFQSYAPEDVADLVDDPNELPLEPVKWFDPADALPAVKALQTHYTTARFIVDRGRRQAGKWEPMDRTDDLLNELRDVEMVLTEAAKAGAKFRFHIGF